MTTDNNGEIGGRAARVLVDAGHGGSATGEVAGGLLEKDINLPIAMALGDYLSGHGINVHYTRTADVDVSLVEREHLINQLSPDVFVSIHCNADPDGNPHTTGFEIFYRDDEDKMLAGSVQKYLVHTDLSPHGGDDGVHQDIAFLHEKLAVLFSDDVPSVLVECGFMTNPTDMLFLQINKYAMAEVIGCGILDYLETRRSAEEDLSV